VDWKRGYVVLLTATSRVERAGKVRRDERVIARLRPEAEDVVRQESPLRLANLTEPVVVLSNSRIYYFAWQEHLPGSRVLTGGAVLVGLAASGELVGYALRIVPPHASLSSVKVSETDAQQAAAEYARSLSSGQPPSFAGAGTLILSSPMAPNGGPIWRFDLSVNGQVVDNIIVDAMTGSVLNPPTGACSPIVPK